MSKNINRESALARVYNNNCVRYLPSGIVYWKCAKISRSLRGNDWKFPCFCVCLMLLHCVSFLLTFMLITRKHFHFHEQVISRRRTARLFQAIAADFCRSSLFITLWHWKVINYSKNVDFSLHFVCSVLWHHVNVKYYYLAAVLQSLLRIEIAKSALKGKENFR